MFVTKMLYDSGDGKNHSKCAPKWLDVFQQLRLLNGSDYDSVVIEAPCGSYMGICGGGNDEFVIAGYLKIGGRYIWASGEGIGKVKYISVCGDENPYLDYEIANFETAVDVAIVFFKHGHLIEKYKWNEDTGATK